MFAQITCFIGGQECKIINKMAPHFSQTDIDNLVSVFASRVRDVESVASAIKTH